MLLAAALAQSDPPAAGGSPLGLLVIAVLGIATVLLIRNMTKRLKRLPPSFGDEPPRDDDAPPPPPAGPSAGSR